ncbi:MAG TPA: hypothetical protein VH186_23955 [Chloroflexia bacterium]|nr:hypothetical protein [Chloroflexia bacterium]
MSNENTELNQDKLYAASDETQEMNPGDQAPAGTPGTGEALCPRCSGKGKLNGQLCEVCGGSGVVVQGIGGA